MQHRYDFREDPNGFTVFDRFTGWPVVIGGVLQSGLDIQDADALAELLDNATAFGIDLPPHLRPQ
jgi:hypothetical protein